MQISTYPHAARPIQRSVPPSSKLPFRADTAQAKHVLPPKHTSAPRFGWGAQSHHAFHQKILNDGGLKSPSLRNFVESNTALINGYSDSLHLYEKGRNHHAHLEDLMGPSYKTKDDVPTFEAVKNRFTPDLKERIKNMIPAQPRTYHQLENTHNKRNALYQTMDAYLKLVSRFRDIAHHKPATEFQQMEVKSDLVRLTARLSHYLADLYQPLHLTNYYTWTLPVRDENERPLSLHPILEYDPDMNNLYHEWGVTPFGRQNLPGTTVGSGSAMATTEFEAQLLRDIRQSYAKVADMAQADAGLRQQLNNGENADSQAYLRDLKSAVAPIMIRQAEKGAHMLVKALESAYQKSGRPDLTTLEPVELEWYSTLANKPV
ncbi:MAG: hypothetical protein KTR14_06300 [Vampirovibrio sp.]|nr:hypothetical protein [Vampirovibrio sp.]